MNLLEAAAQSLIASTKAKPTANSSAPGAVPANVATATLPVPCPRVDANVLSLIQSMSIDAAIKVTVLQRVAAAQNKGMKDVTMMPATADLKADARSHHGWFASANWRGGCAPVIPVDAVPMGNLDLCYHGEVGWIPTRTCLTHCVLPPGPVSVCGRCGSATGCSCGATTRRLTKICHCCGFAATTCRCAVAALILASLMSPDDGAERDRFESDLVARIRRTNAPSTGKPAVDALAGWTPWPARGLAKDKIPNPIWFQQIRVNPMAAIATPVPPTQGPAPDPNSLSGRTDGNSEDRRRRAISAVLHDVPYQLAATNLVNRVRIEMAKAATLEEALAAALANPSKLVRGCRDLARAVQTARERLGMSPTQAVSAPPSSQPPANAVAPPVPTTTPATSLAAAPSSATVKRTAPGATKRSRTSVATANAADPDYQPSPISVDAAILRASILDRLSQLTRSGRSASSAVRLVVDKPAAPIRGRPDAHVLTALAIAEFVGRGPLPAVPSSKSARRADSKRRSKSAVVPQAAQAAQAIAVAAGAEATRTAAAPTPPRAKIESPKPGAASSTPKPRTRVKSAKRVASSGLGKFVSDDMPPNTAMRSSAGPEKDQLRKPVGEDASASPRDRLFTVEYPCTAGLKRSHCAAFSTLLGSEIPSPQAHGIATSEGLRTPAAFVVVDGPRPRATKKNAPPTRACTITISPSGYRYYDGAIAARGTAVLHRRRFSGFDDSEGWMSDPEIVLALLDPGTKSDEYSAAMGELSQTSEVSLLYASLCPTLNPWECPGGRFRSEVVVAAACTAWLAMAYRASGCHDEVAAILSFSDGNVEYIARWRLGMLTDGTYTPLRAIAPKWSDPSTDEPATLLAAREFVARTGWAGLRSAKKVTLRLGLGSELEELVCAGHTEFVELSLDVVVVPHGGGGPHSTRKTRDRVSRLSSSALSVLSDGTVRPGGVAYLPWKGDGSTEVRLAGLLWAAIAAQSGFRLAFGPTSDSSVQTSPSGTPTTSTSTPASPFVAFLADRDFWLDNGEALTPTTGRLVSSDGARLSDSAVGRFPTTAATTVVPPVPTLLVPVPVTRQLELPDGLAREVVAKMRELDADLAVKEFMDRREGCLRRGFANKYGAPRLEDESADDPPKARIAPPVRSLGRPKVSSPYAAFGTHVGTTSGSILAVARFKNLPTIRLLAQRDLVVRTPYEVGRVEPMTVRRVILSSFVAPARLFGAIAPIDSYVTERHFSCGYGLPVSQEYAQCLTPIVSANRFDLAFQHAADPVGCPIVVREDGAIALASPTGAWAYQGHPLVQADAAVAIGLLSIGAKPRDRWLLLSALSLPCLLGGDALRKDLAVAAHMRLLCGRGVRDDTDPFWYASDLLNVQRYLNRGLFFSSRGGFSPPERRKSAPYEIDGIDVRPVARRWILAVARRVIARQAGRCLSFGCGAPTADSAAPAYCPRHALNELRALQGGGGTIAATRREGGMHAAVLAYAQQQGVDLKSPKGSLDLIRRGLADSSLGAYAVWTPVYPANQTGARMQETPSLKVGLAGIVIRATIVQCIDRDAMVTQLRPANGRTEFGIRGLEAPLIAMDATACSDSQDQGLLREMLALCQPALGTSVLDSAANAVFSYTSAPMSAERWARRTRVSSGIEIVVNKRDRAQTVISINGESITFSCLAVQGATGSGKTTLLAALDSQTPIALCLPTRISIQLAAQRATEVTGRRSEVVFLNAGSLEGATRLGGDDDDSSDRAVANGPTDEPPGAARCDRSEDGSVIWKSIRRTEVSASRAFGTPYQLREAKALQSRLPIIDEVHVRDLERAKTLATLVLSGVPFIVASATMPPDLAEVLGVDRSVTIPSPARGPGARFAIANSMPEPGSRTLVVCGSVRDCIERAKKHRGVALHGLLSPSEQEAIANGDGHVYATVGLVGSAITIPGVDVVVVTAKARRVHRHAVGTGEQVETAWSLEEALQIVGRAGRTTERAIAYFEGDRTVLPVDDAPSWAEAIRRSQVTVAKPEELRNLCGEDLFKQTSVLGAPSVPDDVAVLAVQIIGACPGRLALLRAAHSAFAEWLGSPPESVHRALADEERKDFEAGLNPGTILDGQRHAQHYAISDEVVPITPWYARGYVARQAAGWNGSFGIVSTVRLQGKNDLAIARHVTSVPVCRTTISAVVSVNGKVFNSPGIRFGPEGGKIGDIERAAIAGCPLSPNLVGSPMGCNCNGPLVNAAISCAATAADAFVLALETAICEGTAEWNGPKVGWSPASISSTGGDDMITQGGLVSLAANMILREGSGAPSSFRKTGMTPGTRGSSGSAGLISRGRDDQDALSAAFGHFVAGVDGAVAPFLEHYYEPTGRVTTPSPWTPAVRLIAGLVAGDALPDVRAVRSAKVEDVVEQMTGMTADAIASVARLGASRHHRTGATGRLSAEGAKSETWIQVPVWAEEWFATPAETGKAAGRPVGAKVLAAIVKERSTHGRPRCLLCKGLDKTCPECRHPFCESCRVHVCPPKRDHAPVGFAGRFGMQGIVPWFFNHPWCAACRKVELVDQPFAEADYSVCRTCADTDVKPSLPCPALIEVLPAPKDVRLYGSSLGGYVDLAPGLHDRDTVMSLIREGLQNVRLIQHGASQASASMLFLSATAGRSSGFPAGAHPLRTSELSVDWVDPADVPSAIRSYVCAALRSDDPDNHPLGRTLLKEWIDDGAPRSQDGVDPAEWAGRIGETRLRQLAVQFEPNALAALDLRDREGTSTTGGGANLGGGLAERKGAAAVAADGSSTRGGAAARNAQESAPGCGVDDVETVEVDLSRANEPDERQSDDETAEGSESSEPFGLFD